jgi:hypothetical protein
MPSGWFGDFAQAESTYTTEGEDDKDDPTWAVQYGRDPSIDSSFQHSAVLQSDFYHESRSGGPSSAWQTHYPSVSASVSGNNQIENPWRYTPAGWKQDYKPMTTDLSRLNEFAGPRHASWFDNSVGQLDGYGREKTPTASDGRFYTGQWLERSANTTVVCKEPGCKASSTLRLYDAASEEAKLCSLSVHVHPTDYDDDWSQEVVEYWKVNGYITMRGCNPRARGCNATAERPLYSCMNQFNVDKLIDENGTLVIEGKNSIMVDECPHSQKGSSEKNLLSAVAVSTCLVRNKTKPAPGPPRASLFTMEDLHSKSVLKCDKPGCTAETTIHISPAIALNGGTCLMTINLTQTDYDDKLGVPEEVEFIAVGDTNVTTKPVQPGKNPCNDAYKGKNITDVDRIFQLVKGYDVTKMAAKATPLGVLKVTGKISSHVDECGYDGNLLHAEVHVDCTPPKNFTAQPPISASRLLHKVQSGDKDD